MCLRLPTIPVTTALLKTYNVHPDIGVHRARDEMCRDRRGRQRDNRSREPCPTGAAKGQKTRRMIRRWMGGEKVDIRGARESERKIEVLRGPFDEAHFWLNGYVNKQNCRIWSEANPQVYVETPLHPEKLTVWCALWAGGILLQKR
ncbi:hypothetical protein TNCV_3710261 [Trichonephila clavipes]|nr:hypothetical protein TNCV_3710261 [Trichonephila clavipes]